MKDLFRFLAVFLMVVSGLFQRSQAQTVWNGTSDISWYVAGQTSFDISTPEQLAGVATLMNSQVTNFSGITLNLTVDIWLNADNDSTNNWIPIGGYATANDEDANSTSAYAFAGHFKGNGHAIHNLYCEKSGYYQAGLFGCVQYPCVIDSLALVNPVVKARGMSGSLIGYTLNAGDVHISHCIVINCRVQAADKNNNGGLLGANWKMQHGANWTYINDCAVTGFVIGKYAGGIAGNGQKVNTTNVYFAGTIVPIADNGNLNYGGIFGHADDGNYSFTNTYSNITTVSSTGRDATSMAIADMQTATFVSQLGTAFLSDIGINSGFPIMSWMAGISPTSAVICDGESVTLTAMGYNSYLWSDGSTSSAITVQPTSTTTYTVTGTTLTGDTGTHSATVTVYPQAVVSASVVASADGQIHGSVSPEVTTVSCGGSDSVAITVTMDANWRVLRIMQNGTEIYGEQGFGVSTFTIVPNGAMATVEVYLTDALTCTAVQDLTVSNLFGSSVTLSWQPNEMGQLSAYHIYVYNMSYEQGVEYTTTNLIYVLTGLSENTPYRVGVYTRCTDGQSSDTVFVDFVTPCNSPVSLTAGSGTSSTQGQYFPLNAYYKYSYTQQIIPASFLNNEAQNFSSIAFQYFYSTEYTRDVDIYLAHVPVTANLSSGWILPDENLGITFMQVFSGPVTFDNSGADYWFEIPFNHTFAYNGTDNLLLVVLDHTGSYVTNSPKFYTHNDPSTSSMSRYLYRDVSEIDPFSPNNTGTLSSNVNNIRLTYCDEHLCGRPISLTVSNITENSVDLSWMSAGTPLFWEVEYKSDAESGWNLAGTALSSSYTLNGLSASSDYQIRIRSVCDNDEYSLWSDIVNIHTECGPISVLPFGEDFDNPNTIYSSEAQGDYIYCWDRYASDPNHYVCVTSNEHAHNGTYFLNFQPTDGGYNMAILPALAPSLSVSDLLLDFYVCKTGTTGILEVGLMSDHATPSTFVPVDTIDLSSYSIYQYVEKVVFFEGVAGNGRHVAFRVSDAVGGGFYVDDVTLMVKPRCMFPTNLTVENVSATGVTLSWTELGEATTWNIEYGPMGFEPGHGEGTLLHVTTNPYTVSNLTLGLEYEFYVQAGCLGDWSDPVSVIVGQYIMAAVGSDTLTTCGMVIYDDGGPDGNYSNNCNSTLVLYPATEGAILYVNGTASVEHNWEHLYIYDGVGTSGTELLSLSAPNQTVDVVSLSGPLTIKFTSDQYVNSYPGFELFVQCISCIPPYELSVSNLSATSANLTWEGGNSSGSYLVHFYDTDTSIVLVNNNVLPLSNLVANTTYSFAVQSICGTDTSDLSPVYSFTTLTVPANLPYAANFENAGDNAQWGMVNGTQVNQWYIGMPTDAGSDVNTTLGGANGLYVSNDNGVSNSYSGTPSKVYTYRDILVPDGVTELRLSFDWKAIGGSERSEFLRVYWLDPSVVTLTEGSNPPIENGVNYDLYAQPGYNGDVESQHWLSRHNTWQHAEMLISADQFVGMGDGSRIYRLAFHWRNTNYSVNPPAAVDNISLAPITCDPPYDIVVSNITDTSASVAWSGNADFYKLILHSETAETVYITTGNSLVLSGLSANSTYHVELRSYCGTDSSMLTHPVPFFTNCGAVTQLPYIQDFESYITMDDGVIGNEARYIECWSRYTTSSPHVPYYNDNWPHGSSYGVLDFHYTPNCYDIAITPMFDGSIPLNTLMVQFSARKNGSAGIFEIGTMTDPCDPVTYVPYDTIEFNSTNTWENKVILLDHYTGSSQFIAFRSMNASLTSYLLDDLVIDLIPDCVQPLEPVSSNITGTTATVSWSGFADNYLIEYGVSGFTPGSGTMVSVSDSMSFELTNLNPLTSYTVYITSDCGMGGLSVPVSVSFTTTMVAVALPYSTDFSTDQAWQMNNGNCQNYWKIGTTGSGQNALFVTENGVAEEYNISASSTVMAEKLFLMPVADSLHVEFEVRIGGESTWDYFKMFLTPGTEVFIPSSNHNSQSSSDYSDHALNFMAYKSLTGNTSKPYILNLTNGNTLHISENIANPDINGVGKVVFLWRNDNTIGSQPSVVISNFSLSAVSVQPQVTLPTVVTESPTDVTQTTATLNASITNPDSVSIISKGFEWKATFDSVFTQVMGVGTDSIFSASFTGLTPGTSYTYKAFVVISNGTVYGEEMTFTTLEEIVEPCNAPVNIVVSNITKNSITVSWDDDADAVGWRVRYHAIGGDITIVELVSNTCEITGLVPATTYEIQVQAICDDDHYSDWTGVVTVTTMPDGVNDYLENSVVLFPNPASEVVNVQCTMNNVQVEAVEVIDVYGKFVRIVETGHASSPQIRINVSGLATGMYFVRVTTDTGVVTKTFVKQ